MAVTPPPAVDVLPDAPSTTSPGTFAALADLFLAALAGFRAQLVALAANVFGNATDAATNASAAAASAAQSAAASNVVQWVSGTNYAAGVGVWSPLDYQSYRRKITGAGAVDPSIDTANWARIAASTPWVIKTAAYTAIAGDNIQVNTTAAAFSITLPAAPAANDIVQIADYAGTFATNNLTVGRNGSKIMGLAENMTINKPNVSITFAYIDATQGWRIV